MNAPAPGGATLFQVDVCSVLPASSEMNGPENVATTMALALSDAATEFSPPTGPSAPGATATGIGGAAAGAFCTIALALGALDVSAEMLSGAKFRPAEMNWLTTLAGAAGLR